jgi:hypothetical protein
MGKRTYGCDFAMKVLKTRVLLNGKFYFLRIVIEASKTETQTLQTLIQQTLIKRGLIP